MKSSSRKNYSEHVTYRPAPDAEIQRMRHNLHRASDIEWRKTVSLRMDFPSIADMQYGIVGAGRVATALAVSLGDSVAWVAARGEERRLQMRSLLAGVQLHPSVEEIATPPQCIILAVSDPAIQEQAALCARHWGASLDGRFVVHCSGALGRDVLEVCSDAGARTLAVHPFQTIASPSPVVLRGAAWGIEALEGDREFARCFVEYFGGTAFFLSEETRAHKALYHAAASVAANYLTVLSACAADLASAAGIPASLFLPPIMRTALENALAALNSDDALPLTGPIARADVQTLARHIGELRSSPALLREYCLFGLAAAQLAMRRGVLGAEAGNDILTMFYAEIGDNDATP